MGLKVKLTKGIASASERQLRTIQGLGLRRFGDERLLKDSPSIRGMVFLVRHLVSHEIVSDEPKPSRRRKPKKIVRRDQARAKATAAARS